MGTYGKPKSTRYIGQRRDYPRHVHASAKGRGANSGASCVPVVIVGAGVAGALLFTVSALIMSYVA